MAAPSALLTAQNIPSVFPVITQADGLREIDNYLQRYIRYLSTGRHTKANYRIRYADLKALGYRSLVHEYYRR